MLRDLLFAISVRKEHEKKINNKNDEIEIYEM